MMNESERAKVREYIKGHPEATAEGIEWLLGREMDALEVVETALIMTGVKAEAKHGASGAEKAEAKHDATDSGRSEASAHCRLEIDFSLTPDAQGYSCGVSMRIPGDVLSDMAGLRQIVCSHVLRKAVSKIRDELVARLESGDLKRCIAEAENEATSGREGAK